MKKFLPKVIAFILLFSFGSLAILPLYTPPLRAQTLLEEPIYSPPLSTTSAKGEVKGDVLGIPIIGDIGEWIFDNIAKLVAKIIEALMKALIMLLGGEEDWAGGEGGGGYNIYDEEQHADNFFRRHGAIGVMSSLIASIYENPPSVETVNFIKQSLSNNLLGIKFAQAATPLDVTPGGAILLSAHVDILWKFARDISYLFLVVILIAFGFMIMFRYRIDPRTTMTIQAALPRIVVVLVLITFSFPLAGFLMDLGNVLTKVIDNILIEAFNMGPSGVSGPEPVGVWSIMRKFAITLDIGPIAMGVFPLELLLQLVVRIVGFVLALYIFYILITRYAALFMQTVFAPLAFLWGALPGQEDTTSKWFKSFIVNVLTLPAVFLIVNIAYWVRVNAVIPLPPTWEATHRGNIAGLIALGILFNATKIPAMLEDALEVTTPAAVAKAGPELRGVLRGIPLVGRLV